MDFVMGLGSSDSCFTGIIFTPWMHIRLIYCANSR
jgi:hypothetical protein